MRETAVLPDQLERLYEPIQEQLERVRKGLRRLASDQDEYLAEPLEHILQTTGKGLRPAVTLLAARLHPNDGRNAELMAAAVELLHIASLIHDDTVDDSDLRRGFATVSSLWGRNAAVLVGDYVFATSATYVCDTGNVHVIRRFAETIMSLASGELQEMASAFQTTQAREAYLKRIYDKTASLFTTAAESGAILGGAVEDEVTALKSYGYNMGMSFQIVDDILDFDATREEVGKPVGADLAQGIMTMPTIIAVETGEADNPVLQSLRRPGDDESLALAVKTAQDPAIIDQSYAVADSYSMAAVEALAVLDSSPARDSLEQIARYVVARRY